MITTSLLCSAYGGYQQTYVSNKEEFKQNNENEFSTDDLESPSENNFLLPHTDQLTNRVGLPITSNTSITLSNDERGITEDAMQIESHSTEVMDSSYDISSSHNINYNSMNPSTSSISQFHQINNGDTVVRIGGPTERHHCDTEYEYRPNNEGQPTSVDDYAVLAVNVNSGVHLVEENPFRRNYSDSRNDWENANDNEISNGNNIFPLGNETRYDAPDDMNNGDHPYSIRVQTSTLSIASSADEVNYSIAPYAYIAPSSNAMNCVDVNPLSSSSTYSSRAAPGEIMNAFSALNLTRPNINYDLHDTTLMGGAVTQSANDDEVTMYCLAVARSSSDNISQADQNSAAEYEDSSASLRNGNNCDHEPLSSDDVINYDAEIHNNCYCSGHASYSYDTTNTNEYSGNASDRRMSADQTSIKRLQQNSVNDDDHVDDCDFTEDSDHLDSRDRINDCGQDDDSGHNDNDDTDGSDNFGTNSTATFGISSLSLSDSDSNDVNDVGLVACDEEQIKPTTSKGKRKSCASTSQTSSDDLPVNSYHMIIADAPNCPKSSRSSDLICRANNSDSDSVNSVRVDGGNENIDEEADSNSGKDEICVGHRDEKIRQEVGNMSNTKINALMKDTRKNYDISDFSSTRPIQIKAVNYPHQP